MILGKKPNLIENWPKMWPTCFLRPGKGSEGLKSDFGGKKTNLAKFGRKWQKMCPTCIFRPGGRLEDLKSDFWGKNQIW